MSDDTIRLSRRRLLGGLVTIGGAGLAMGAGTMAAFSDTESNSSNAVQAGTLDLELGDEDRDVTFLDERDVRPDDNDSSQLELKNTGTVDGSLEINLAAIRTANKNGNAAGQLQNYLEVAATVGSKEVIPRQPVAELSEGPLSFQPVTITANGGSEMFTLSWWLPSSTSNRAQGDSVSLDFTFRLVNGGGSP